MNCEMNCNTIAKLLVGAIVFAAALPLSDETCFLWGLSPVGRAIIAENCSFYVDFEPEIWGVSP